MTFGIKYRVFLCRHLIIKWTALLLGSQSDVTLHLVLDIATVQTLPCLVAKPFKLFYRINFLYDKLFYTRHI